MSVYEKISMNGDTPGAKENRIRLAAEVLGNRQETHCLTETKKGNTLTRTDKAQTPAVKAQNGTSAYSQFGHNSKECTSFLILGYSLSIATFSLPIHKYCWAIFILGQDKRYCLT